MWLAGCRLPVLRGASGPAVCESEPFPPIMKFRDGMRVSLSSARMWVSKRGVSVPSSLVPDNGKEDKTHSLLWCLRENQGTQKGVVHHLSFQSIMRNVVRCLETPKHWLLCFRKRGFHRILLIDEQLWCQESRLNRGLDYLLCLLKCVRGDVIILKGVQLNLLMLF